MPFDPNQLDALVRQADPATSDADLAAQLSVPIISLKPSGPATMVKFRTLDDLFPDPTETKRISDGLDATITALTGSASAAQQALGAKLQRAKGYMQGTSETDGIDVSNPGVRATVQQMVPMILTQPEVDTILARGGTTTYPAGGVVSAADVTASRARVARADAINALVAKGEAEWSAFLSSVVNPAANDPAKPLPTWADRQAHVAGVQ